MLVFWCVLIALVSVPGLIWPAEVYGISATFRFRTPAAVEPSARRIRMVRLASATFLLIGLCGAVGGLWPSSDTGTKATAALVVAVVGILAIIATLILAAVRRSRSAALRAREDELPPDEPSELAYGTDIIGVVAYLVLLVVVIVSIISIDRAEDEEPTAEEQQQVDQQEQDAAQQRFNTLHLARLPVTDVIPPGASLARPLGYDAIDAADEKPRILFQGSTIDGTAGEDGTVALADADLDLLFTGLNCDILGLVVGETEDTVTVAVIVLGGTPNPDSTMVDCNSMSPLHNDRYLVELDAPLGARTVIDTDGRRIAVATDYDYEGDF